MWVPNRTASRVQRTSSVHSIASVHSPSQTKPPTAVGNNHPSGAFISDQPAATFLDDVRSGVDREAPGTVPDAWRTQRRQLEAAHGKLSLRSENGPRITTIAVHKDQWEVGTDDDSTSRSSTLDGEEDYMDHMEKRNTSSIPARVEVRSDEPHSPILAPHIPGPLESQLAALMSKLIYIEQANPAISVRPEEYEKMQGRIKELEEEKKSWWKRHDAIWALRDEDVENNIKIRGLLAKCRRELDMTKALRDEDLANVQSVRAKLAEKTRELERLHAQTGRVSPNRGRPGSFFERRGTSDLFVAAKTAALEQRALELEKRNSDLVAQVETLKSGANVDDLNQLTAHPAWKDTVGDLEAKIKVKDAEISRLRPGSVGTEGGMDWYRVEALLEEHASYREAVGGRLQALRSDKEVLQKELHQKENACQALELRLQSLQRRSTVL